MNSFVFWACLVLFLFLVVCVIIVVLIWPWMWTMPSFFPINSNVTYDCVVAAYRENLHWLTPEANFLPGKPNVIVYSKHEDTSTKNANNNPFSENQTISLPNVGRCDHTYLYHIVHNYDNLAPKTLFVTGSAYKLPMKRSKLRVVIFPRIASNSYKCLGYAVTFFPQRWRTKAKWRARNPENFTKSIHENAQCIPADTRPYGKWWDAHFGGTIPFPFYSVMSGMFVATRDAIRSVPLETWKALLKEHEVGDNVEVGHFMELSWYQLLNYGYILK